jgi:hypothetical protein
MGRYLTDDEANNLAPAAASGADATTYPAADSRYLSDDEAGFASQGAPQAAIDPKDVALAGDSANPWGNLPSPQFARAVGLIPRMALHGVGQAVGGWLVDPFVNAINGVAGTHIPSLLDSTNAYANVLGMPAAATPTEKLVDNLGTGTVSATGFANGLRMLAGSAFNRFAPYVGEALTASADAAGANPGAVVGGAATGTYSAEKADQFAANHGFSPTARFFTDLAASTIGGLPGSAMASKVANGMPMLTSAGLVPGIAATDEQNALIDAGRKFNVPLNAQDVGKPNGWWASLAKIASKAPFASSIPNKTAQQQTAAIRNGLNTIADSYTPDGLGTTYNNIDQLLGGDFRGGYSQAKQNASGAFDNVETAIAANPGSEKMQLTRLGPAAQTLLQSYPKVFDDLNIDAPLKSKLESIVAQTGPQNSVILQPNGQPFQNPPNITYSDARSLSKSLWQMREQATKRALSGQGNWNQARMIGDLYSALNGDGTPGAGGDIGDWAANAPNGIGNLHNAAINTFKNQVLPFRADPQMYNLVSSRTPTGSPEYDLAVQGLYNNYFNAAQTERAPYALNLLSPNGQRAVAFQALRNAAIKGASPNMAGIGVARGLRALDPDSQVLDTIMDKNPGMKGSVDDVRRLLNVGRNANNVLADPKTGNQLVGMASTFGGLAIGEHFADKFGLSPAEAALAAPAAVAGMTGAGTAVHALSRYLPKSLLFATPGNTTTNSVGPLMGLNTAIAAPAPLGGLLQ